MSATIPFKRLILRAVLRDVSPMVARLISVNEDTELSDLHDVFQQVLGWGGDLGYSFRIHGKEFNSLRESLMERALCYPYVATLCPSVGLFTGKER